MSNRRGRRAVEPDPPQGDEDAGEVVGAAAIPRVVRSPPPILPQASPPPYNQAINPPPQVEAQNPGIQNALLHTLDQLMQQQQRFMQEQVHIQRETHNELLAAVRGINANQNPHVHRPGVRLPELNRRPDRLNIHGRPIPNVPLWPENRNAPNIFMDAINANAQENGNARANGNGQARMHHLKTSDIRIPTYAGAWDGKTPYDYLLELEKYQAIVGYTEIEMLNNVIPLSLVQDAYNWYRYEPQFENWNDFKRRLRTEFQAVGYKEDLKRELDKRYQGPNETLTSFIRIITDYFERIGDRVEEEMIVNLVKRLMHPDYRKALIGMPCNTIEELKNSAPLAQELIKSYRSYKLPPVSGNLEPSLAWKPITKGAENIPTNLVEGSSSPQPITQSPRLHMASVDPFSYFHTPKKEVKFQSSTYSQPKRSESPVRNTRSTSPVRKCFICGSLQHIAPSCPQRTFRPQSPVKPGSSVNLFHPNDDENLAAEELKDGERTKGMSFKPFIKVKLMNEEFLAFLDTGASVSVLGDRVIKIIEKHGIKCRNEKKEIRLLHGNYTATKAVTLNLTYEAGMRKQSFLLVPGTIQEVLLGRDFLIPSNIGIFIGLGGWTIGRNLETFHSFIPSPDNFLCNFSFIPTANQSEVNDDDLMILLEESDCPAQILSTWECPEVAEPRQSHTETIKLFPNLSIGIEVPAYLSESRQREIREVIRPFLSIFTKAPGLCTAYEHSIDTGNNKPVSSNPFPMTPAKRKIFDETFYELVKYDVIEPSVSPWSSSCFIVPKRDGSHRFVVDYRPLNKVTVPDVYPIPRMQDMLAYIGQCSHFATFDISKGYYQVKMADKDKCKTAFISHHGLWQFKRMPMGPMNSASTFMRLIDVILGDLKWKICTVYFDDVLIFSKDWNSHLVHISLVLTCLKEAGLTIHPTKVQLCRQTFKYLGFIIEPGKCHPDPEKVDCLRSYPTPKNVKHIQKFLGLIGFYRRFIPFFSEKAQPLIKLLKKDVAFEWNAEVEESFHYLKNTLSNYSEVYLPDINGQFIVQCDASDSGIGAILLQEKEGERHPIWFVSRTLKPAETRYSASEKELLAVLYAIDKFRGFIEYSHFILETDHQALSWLYRVKEPAGRLARWYLTLQMFDFEIRYRPGNSPAMRGSDSLSRIHEVLFADTHSALTRNDLIEEQNSDEFLGEIISYLKNASSNASESIIKNASKASLATDGLLMRYVGPRNKPWEDERLHWRVWIPQSLVQTVMSHFHTTSGHLGIRKTFGKIEQRAYWKNLRRNVQELVKNCLECQMAKRPRLPPVPATSYTPDAPWSVISIDLMGPYAKGANQNTYLLVIVDYFTKYVELFPLRQAKALKITEKLWEVCCRWGVPNSIVSDNGPQFASKVYQDFCEMVGMKCLYISPYHPQANIVERYNQVVKSIIVATISKCRDWDRRIHDIAFTMRTSISDSTGYTPAYLNTGREFRVPFDNAIGLEHSSHDLKAFAKKLSTIHNVARDEIENAQSKYLHYYNRKAKSHEYEVGSKVWLKTHFLSDASKGFTAALAKKREGPYFISNVVAKNVYDLVSCEDANMRVKRVHANELSPFFSSAKQSGESPGTSEEVHTNSWLLPTTSFLLSDDESWYDAANVATNATTDPQSQESISASKNSTANCQL